MKKVNIKMIALCAVICLLAACAGDEQESTPCGKGADNCTSFGTPGSPILDYYGGQEFSPGTVYVKYITKDAGSRVQFIVGGTANNICTKEHLTVSFSYTLRIEEQTLPLKIFGRAFWDPFYGDEEIILADGLLSPYDHPEPKQLQIGLSQVFPNGDATVNFYATLEFETQGGLDQDIDYFQSHIESFGFNCSYYLFK